MRRGGVRGRREARSHGALQEFVGSLSVLESHKGTMRKESDGI